MNPRYIPGLSACIAAARAPLWRSDAIQGWSGIDVYDTHRAAAGRRRARAARRATSQWPWPCPRTPAAGHAACCLPPRSTSIRRCAPAAGWRAACGWRRAGRERGRTRPWTTRAQAPRARSRCRPLATPLSLECVVDLVAQLLDWVVWRCEPTAYDNPTAKCVWCCLWRLEGAGRACPACRGERGATRRRRVLRQREACSVSRRPTACRWRSAGESRRESLAGEV